MISPRFLAVLPLLAAAAHAATPDWSQWRGPNRDGVSAEIGLLKEWPADGPKLEWQTKGIGKGMGSVAIHAGKIFVLGQRSGGQHIVAFDLATQRELWSARVSESGDEPTGTPTVDGGQVFAVSKDGKLLCCAEADGKETNAIPSRPSAFSNTHLIERSSSTIQTGFISFQTNTLRWT